MSIRNRVMLGTLALAVAGFVGTLGAAEDKILIVRDGSVEVYSINSSFEERREDRRQKWSKKADRVQVFEDEGSAEACTTKLNDPVKFDRVELKIMDLENNRPVSIVGENDGFLLKKLKFLMPDEWRFVFRQYKHRLVFGSQAQNQERKVKFQQVVITDDAGAAMSYPAKPSTRYLCVRFTNH